MSPAHAAGDPLQMGRCAQRRGLRSGIYDPGGLAAGERARPAGASLARAELARFIAFPSPAVRNDEAPAKPVVSGKHTAGRTACRVFPSRRYPAFACGR